MNGNEEEIMMEKYSETDRTDTLRAVFAGLGIGLLVGLAIGVLVAPKTGRETRTQLKDIAGDLGKKAKDLASGFGDKFTSTKEAVKRGAKAVKEGYTEKMEELKEED
jgi:gas vesicle protein